MKISGTTGIDLSGLPINNSGNAEVEGNLNLSGVGKRITGDFSNATVSNRVAFQTSTLNSATVVGVLPNGTATSSFLPIYNNSDNNNASSIQISARATIVSIDTTASGTGTILPLAFTTGGTERLRIDISGNILVTGSGGLGYGTGSGGTVTQLTSKSTTVTLNKPTGQITTSNSALAGTTAVAFTFNNTLITSNDTIKIACNSLNYRVFESTISNGGCTVVIENRTGVSLSDAIVLNFTVIKGANA